MHETPNRQVVRQAWASVLPKTRPLFHRNASEILATFKRLHLKIEPRTWKLIAEEIAQETDPHRILELSRELNAAIAEQGIGGPENFSLLGEIRRRIKTMAA